ncbi:MAG TPA: hypothetical protein VMB85_20380 [Bryobacteraceae bacterium]|nr:hypothetical protein [Bryobacteraceae bacterium]
MATILDYYNLDRGDLIYGIGEQINKYLDHLWKEGKLVTTLTAMQLKTDKYAAINTYNRAIGNNVFSLNATTIEVDLRKIQTGAQAVDRNTLPKGYTYTQDYVAKLLKSKFSPATVSGDLNSDSSAKLKTALLKGRDDLAVSTSASDIAAAAKELAIRRSCKFGIEYVLKLDKAMIHYVLDEMNMLKVAQKDWFDKTIPKTGASVSFRKISICTTELRYLFRNWGRIGPTDRVKFYYNFSAIVPPWTDDFFKATKQWADYAKHLAEKHLGDKKQSVLDLYQANKYAEAVNEYHKVAGNREI